MSSNPSRPYALHSAGECERLERQAALADLPRHLGFFAVPPEAAILDAGCGSGSMARLLASRHKDARVVGVDLRGDYIAYAQERAQRQRLRNIEFRAGDIFHLPFADASFDVVWSKYVLQWVERPHLAVAEFRRVTKPGGIVVSANFDGFAVTHWPEDAELQPMVERVFPRLVDPFIGRKMAPMFRAAGLRDIEVDFEADRLFTVTGAIDAERRRNWLEQLAAARSFIAQTLGGEDAADRFVDAFIAYQDRADTCSYTALYFVRGRAP
jgi:ubiquinone/menaquinone biosynthesis C-methylase UbiE